MTSTAPHEPIRIAIVGGGIGGLACAVGLLGLNSSSSEKVDVHIFESAPKFAEIGAGISVGKNAQTALKLLHTPYDDNASSSSSSSPSKESDDDLFARFLKIADTTPASSLYFQFRGGADNQVYSEAYHAPLGQCSVHRAELLDVLVQYVPPSRAHFGKRLASVAQRADDDGEGAPVQLTFEDGSTFECDVLIGYDGIHSTVRRFLDAKKSGLGPSLAGPSKKAGSASSNTNGASSASTEQGSSLVWSGTWAYRAMIPHAKMVAELGAEDGDFYTKTSQMWFGQDTHIITFPIKGGTVNNVVAFITDRSQWPERSKLPEGEAWVQKGDKDHVVATFKEKGYHRIPLAILDMFEDPGRWALHQIVPSLKSYTKGRILVAGDAAHGGVPHLGAMAGQAIEDALFLTRLFGHPLVDRSNVTRVLPLFDQLRLPRANAVLEASLHQGEIYEFYGEHRSSLPDVGPQARDTWNYVVDHDFAKEAQRIDQEVKKALGDK